MVPQITARTKAVIKIRLLRKIFEPKGKERKLHNKNVRDFTLIVNIRTIKLTRTS